jgi:hypothetical protein
MENKLLSKIKFLQICVFGLFLLNTVFVINYFFPLLPQQPFKIINAERINIREKNGILKAALSNSAGFNEGQRAEQGAVRLSGLMFYNEEGQETGGLVYFGKAIPGGQDADVSLTFDQYNQDQNVYLHHVEHKDSLGLSIEDGLTINSRPDWKGVKEEYSIYNEMERLPPDELEALKFKSLQAGKISTRRAFFGVRRGTSNLEPYDDAGLFLKNKWGRDAIKIYIDKDNKPHFEIYDSLGKSILYEIKLSQPN